MITTLDQIVEATREHPRQALAVAAAESASVLEAVRDARREGIADPILFGGERRIRELAEEVGLDVTDVGIVDAPDDLTAAALAVRAVNEGRASLLMKGQLHTDDFLRALLDKEQGLRSGLLMSHCFLLERTPPASGPEAAPGDEERPRLLIVTDGAMNIAPTLEQKAQIILNAVYLAQTLGIEQPKVGVLAAVEVVNPAMPATVDAAALATMDRHGQFPSCCIDGPLALDNAISILAAQVKGIEGDVAGRCDILLAPDIESGNILAKAHSFLGGGAVAGVLVGASAPVVLTSRADAAKSKLYSIATAVLMAGIHRTGRLKIGRVHF